MSKRPLRETLSKDTLKFIGIPKSIITKNLDDFETFDDYDYEKVKNTIQDYLDTLDDNFDNNIGVTLYGSNGVGKTFLASIIIKEAYRHRYSAYRITFADYMSAYTRVWKARNEDEQSEFEEHLYSFKAAEFLALEEVGKEVDSKITAPILEDLLRYREDKGLPVILCMNLRMNVLEEKYGVSVSSLIRGNTLPVKIDGEDKRLHYFRKRSR